MPRALPGLFATALLLAPAAVAAVVPLRIDDATPRPVYIQVENSSDLATVGQSFGTFLATYSASAGVGTLTVDPQTFSQFEPIAIPPVPGSFTPFVIQIDLATKHATSQAASGTYAAGGQSQSFTLHPLASNATLGFTGPGIPPLPCVSQQQVDAWCPIVPMFCGKTCTLVSGSAYDASSGEVNLVGSETLSGCDGSFCQGPFDFFSGRGDLRLTEELAPPIPALSQPGKLTLAWLLAAAVLVGARRSRAAPAIRGMTGNARPPGPGRPRGPCGFRSAGARDYSSSPASSFGGITLTL